jgi:hypothetical protein
MDGELVYEIARYSPRGEQEQLLERTQVVRRGQTLWRRGADGVGVACSGNDVAAVIGADPTLGEVRADEITRIQANRESQRVLPLVLSAPGGGELVDRSLWSDVMWDKHLEDAGSTIERGVHRVLYVNEARWPVFPTSEGERFLPDDPEGDGTEPLLAVRWALMGFTEEGSMVSGFDRTEIGLVTPGVVACITRLDDESPKEVWLRRRDNDAATFVNWLFGGPFSTSLELDNPRGAQLLTQLFVEASLGGHNGEDVAGSRLIDYAYGSPPWFGYNDSSMWTLELALEPSVVNAILDLMADRGPRLAEIVEAAQNPDSPAGHARRAWLEQQEQERETA